MDLAINAITLVQLFFAVIIGMYFFNLLKSQQGNRSAINRESQHELKQLEQLREVKLTQPLAEKTRPTAFAEIIGQSEAIRALKAAMCGENPQHVILYGPPGVGKTAAARLVLDAARKNPQSPFSADAKFIEIDATTARFDERGIADPLIGTVHDPIYQGAGAFGSAGIPRPKPGAVTKAHGGILFIDEIGELHHIQLNKLLKVLEDRKVMLESSYYHCEDDNIPQYIHEIFQHGLPADFRMIAATTRLPQEIPAAIRSRCVEIFFRSLQPSEIGIVAENALRRTGAEYDKSAVDVIKKYSLNGRDAVNIVQLAVGIAQNEHSAVTAGTIEWVADFGQYEPHIEKQLVYRPQIGVVNGLAVYGANNGAVIEIEAAAIKVPHGSGSLRLTGIVEEEEIASSQHTIHRKSMAKSSVENVMTVLSERFGIDFSEYALHVNFPSAGPVDGPSAGTAAATAIYSAVKQLPVNNMYVLTGELSIHGHVYPVGGVSAKIAAAKRAGAVKVLIPCQNMQQMFSDEAEKIKIVPVKDLTEVLTIMLDNNINIEESRQQESDIMAAKGISAR